MADDIRLDKITMRGKIQGSLDRLMKQNYIGRNGDTYKFLTDEEQDIQIDIRNTMVDTSAIVEKISHIIYGEIFTAKKFRYKKYDFPFTQMVDSTVVGSPNGSMVLKILTVATDEIEKDPFRLSLTSQGCAVVVLEESKYYDEIESAMKIRKYVKQKNVAQLAKSIQDIIRSHQNEADKYEKEAADLLRSAIRNAKFFVDGENISISGTDPKAKMEQALQFLLERIYTGLDKIGCNYENDGDIIAILNGTNRTLDERSDPNYEAYAEVLSYLEMQYKMKLPTSMFDIQKRYQDKPYGWREVDIAAVVARLIVNEKITVKYGGTQIQPDNPKLPDMLRKKSEIGKVSVSKFITIPPQEVKEVREFLRDFFDIMDVPMKENELVHDIAERFENLLNHYNDLLAKYENHSYPDKQLIVKAISAVKAVLNQQKDNIALVHYIVTHEDDLYDVSDSMKNIEEFFKSRVQIFDAAVELEKNLHDDIDFIKADANANDALNKIRLYTMVTDKKFEYGRIPSLNGLMDTVTQAHEKMLEEKRGEIRSNISQCIMTIRETATDRVRTKDILDRADEFFENERRKLDEMTVIALMDGLLPRIWQKKDEFCEQIDAAVRFEQDKPNSSPKNLRAVAKMAIFPSKTLTSEDEIDSYLKNVREHLLQMLDGHDGIKLN
jgi:hypothetical protein